MHRRLALVVAATALSGACSGEAPPTGVSAAEPAVGADESYKVLRDWTARHNKALTSGAEDAWRDTVTGALAGPVGARVAMYGKLGKSAEISPANPVMYVPRLTGYPKWFAVAALERGDRDGQVLAVFVRRTASDGWRAAHWLAYKGRPPEIAVDAQGYAVTADPGGAAEAHTRYLTTGADDRFTPDAYSRRARAATASGSRFDATGHPSYALRARNGGTLVWYAFDQTRRFPATAPPDDVRAYLARTRTEPTGQIQATWTWLAIGYLPTTGRSHVLGESVTLTTAS